MRVLLLSGSMREKLVSTAVCLICKLMVNGLQICSTALKGGSSASRMLSSMRKAAPGRAEPGDRVRIGDNDVEKLSKALTVDLWIDDLAEYRSEERCRRLWPAEPGVDDAAEQHVSRESSQS